MIIQTNCYCQGLLFDEIFDSLDDKSKTNLVVLGQKYNVKGDKLLALELVQYMNKNFGPTTWIIDETPSYVYYLNKYLKTKSDDFRKILIKQKTPGLRKDEKQFLDSILKLSEQRINFKIVSVMPIDQSNIVFNLSTVSQIIHSLDSIPELLAPDLKKLQQLTDNKVFAPSYDKIEESIKNIKSNYEEHPKLFQELFQSDLESFMTILEAAQMLIHYPLLNISPELFDNRLLYSLPLIEKELMKSSSHILFQTRSILASKRAGNFDNIFNNWIPIIPRLNDELQDKYNLIYGNIYYKKMPNLNINLNVEGIVVSKTDNHEFKVFSLEKEKSSYFDFIIVNNR